jgi:hypothetical protein
VAWVVLCSGFRERVVRRVFDHITLCFCDWESASAIVDADPACRVAAMASFRNAAKLGAIAETAHHVHARSFASFKQAVLADPLTELQRLPHVGPITVWHLAKNLGLDVAKPDRHLARVSTQHLCSELARKTGEQKKVVDLVVWRYLADNAHERMEDYVTTIVEGDGVYSADITSTNPNATLRSIKRNQA